MRQKEILRVGSIVILSVLLATWILGLVLKGRQDRKRLKETSAALKKAENAIKQGVVRLNEQEKRFLRSLGWRYGVSDSPEPQWRDLFRYAGRMVVESDAGLDEGRVTKKTGLNPAQPKTLKGREISFLGREFFELERGVFRVGMEGGLYQYAIRNPTESPVPMPVLYSGFRWDDAERLVESAGFLSVQDELDRALAIWRFVSEWTMHSLPVTEGQEEHELIKFLSCYGYGFCDDASQALCGLARLSGLRTRIWGLDGHVVPEIFAGGQWRLLDPDFAVYFHRPGESRQILGVEELSVSREAFRSYIQLGRHQSFDGEYADWFLSRENNRGWPERWGSSHRLEGVLVPGEKVVFSNFNWGLYFLGAYPQRGGSYLNGYFERPIQPSNLSIPEGLEVVPEGRGYRIANPAPEPLSIEVAVHSPFPVVGGVLSSPVGLDVEFEDVQTRRKHGLLRGKSLRIDGLVSQVGPKPTFDFVLRIRVPARSALVFPEPPTLIWDFQFAELALVPLRGGMAEFSVYTPRPETLSKLEAEVRWK
jgi:hypothetical protein